MHIAFALLALAAQPVPVAPQPREVRGWISQHTFTHKAPVRAVTSLPDAFVTGDKDGVLLLWDAKTGKLRETLLDGTNEQAKPIDLVRPRPDRKRLDVFTNGFPGQVMLTGKDRAYYGPDFTWKCLAITGNGLWLATKPEEANPNHTLYLLTKTYGSDGYSSATLFYLTHDVRVRIAASTLALFVSVDDDDTIRAWRATKLPDPKSFDYQLGGSDRPVWKVIAKDNKPTALAISPDGKLVAVAGANGEVAILDFRRGETQVTLKGHQGAVGSVAFSPDSGLIATGGADGTVRLWNPATGEEEAQLKGHTANVATVWFASDDVLMTASDDKTARVWTYKP